MSLLRKSKIILTISLIIILSLIIRNTYNYVFASSKEVTEIFSPIHDDLITITFSNGVEVTCTYDHPFYVNGLNLSSYRPKQTLERYEFDREVGKLKEGDILKDVELNEVSVVSIKELDREKTQTYIFTVEDNHNFFANGLLTHNKME